MASVDYSFFPMGMITYPEDNAWGQYKHYLRDKTLMQYGASLIGERIGGSIEKVAASLSQTIYSAVGNLADTVATVGDRICGNMKDMNQSLMELNRRMDMMVEQQRMSNLLLQNIAELLKIPDSEKERQQAITNGIRFMANANINPEMYSDALEEFLKAEAYQKQDYFVLHRIGMIYLFSEEFLDPLKAFGYFARAAKYAKVESDPNAVRVANLLTNPVNVAYVQGYSNSNSVLLLAADSYEKAAFAAYVGNDLPRAIEYQQAAISLQGSPQRLFLLSKYQAHENDMAQSLSWLRQAIDGDPNLLAAVFQEVDMMVRPEVIDFVDTTDRRTTESIERMVVDLQGKVNTDLLEQALAEGSFADRVRVVKRYRRRLNLD